MIMLFQFTEWALFSSCSVFCSHHSSKLECTVLLIDQVESYRVKIWWTVVCNNGDGTPTAWPLAP